MLTHWSYIFLAPTHRIMYNLFLYLFNFQENAMLLVPLALRPVQSELFMDHVTCIQPEDGMLDGAIITACCSILNFLHAGNRDKNMPISEVSNEININKLRLRQNCNYLAGIYFNCIFLNENVYISVQIPVKFVPKGLTDNGLALVQLIAWRQTGDKPLFEPVMVLFTDIYMHH